MTWILETYKCTSKQQPAMIERNQICKWNGLEISLQIDRKGLITRQLICRAAVKSHYGRERSKKQRAINLSTSGIAVKSNYKKSQEQ